MDKKNNRAPRAMVNGVDVARLKSTMEAIAAVPALAKFTFRASNRWIRGGLSRSTVGGFHGAGAENRREVFVIDSGEPALILGGDEAPTPVEYLLHAMVGCLTRTLVYLAALEGVRIEALQSQIEGRLDLRSFLGLREDLPGGFEEVSVKLRVQADCPPQKLAELAGVAQRRSPITNFVVRAVPVSVSCELA